MNIHKHRTKQTCESYTFQPLMSFWLWLNVPIQVFACCFVVSISTVSRIFSLWKQIHDVLFCSLFRSSKLLILINQLVNFSNIIFVLWCRSANNALMKLKTTTTKSNVIQPRWHTISSAGIIWVTPMDLCWNCFFFLHHFVTLCIHSILLFSYVFHAFSECLSIFQQLLGYSFCSSLLRHGHCYGTEGKWRNTKSFGIPRHELSCNNATTWLITDRFFYSRLTPLLLLGVNRIYLP